MKNNSFISSKNKYYLGLDLGISSVGWAVMVQEPNNNYLHDFGVRIFDVAEEPKTKISLAQKRREFRSQRRLIRRRAYRIERIKKLLGNSFNNHSLLHTNKIIKKNGSFTTEKGYWNPFVARNKGLEEKLTRAEIYTVLIHFCQKRGYLDKFSMDEKYEELDKNNPKHQKRYQNWVEKNENIGKTFADFKKLKESNFSSAIIKADKLIKKHKYVARTVLNEPDFHIKKSKQILIHTKNDKDNYRYLFSRKAYKNELKAILEKQSTYYEEIKKIKDELFEVVFQQRNFEDGPKCKNHKMNIKNNIKCNPNICSTKYNTFIDMVSNCLFYPKEKRGYKSSITFSAYYFVVEISKFLSFLRNKIEIKIKDYQLKELLNNFMIKNWQKKKLRII